MKNNDKLYLVWEQDGDEIDQGYWSSYDSLEDAVQSYDKVVEVFEAPLKSIGYFTTKTTVAKVKGKKK